MRYYIIADPHAHYTIMRKALADAGYDEDAGDKKLVICGDLLDRGKETVEMQDYIYKLLMEDAVILIRGNHEDLLEDLVDNLDSYAQIGVHYTHHAANRTLKTLCDLAQCSVGKIEAEPYQIRGRMRQTPMLKVIMPAMVDYYETPHYVFVHGWIPCKDLAPAGRPHDWVYDPDWRHATLTPWEQARWINGMDAAKAGVLVPDKTVVCGHWHCSYGHAVLEGKGDEYGPDADFSPYRAQGIIAIDACTALSGRMNVLVLDD